MKKSDGTGVPDDTDLVPIELVVLDSIVEAECAACGMTYEVEPDARGYDCFDGCNAIATVTSPLVQLGLI